MKFPVKQTEQGKEYRRNKNILNKVKRNYAGKNIFFCAAELGEIDECRIHRNHKEVIDKNRGKDLYSRAQNERKRECTAFSGRFKQIVIQEPNCENEGTVDQEIGQFANHGCGCNS